MHDNLRDVVDNLTLISVLFDMEDALNKALQRISDLERIARTPSISQFGRESVAMSTNCSSTANATTSTSVPEEICRRFPSLRRPQASPETSVSRTRRREQHFYQAATGRKKSSTSACRNNKYSKPVLRDLVLIPNPGEETVPTHSTRVMLDSKGFVVHSFPFQREWDTQILTRKLAEAFPKYLLLCFEYMKVS